MGMLDGQVALITGAARAQGRAHAVTCAREGADVIAVDINAQLSTVGYPMATPADLAETARLVEACDRRVLAVTADVRDQSQLDEAVTRGLAAFGGIDILIANAGIWNQSPFWEISDDQWDQVVGVNLTGVWRSAKAVAPHMIERQRGSLVFTASINGHEAGRDRAHYVAAKFGVIGLMKTVALELAPHGIRANAVCPGAIRSGMTEHPDLWTMYAGQATPTEEDFVEAGRRFGSLKGTSWLTPQVIADAALYLNSDLAAAVTGVSLPVDAGHLLLPGVNANPVR